MANPPIQHPNPRPIPVEPPPKPEPVKEPPQPKRDRERQASRDLHELAR